MSEELEENAGPSQEQIKAALDLIDEHLAVCSDRPCPGIENELGAIHPSFRQLAEEVAARVHSQQGVG